MMHDDSPFADLPAALVEELLGQASTIGERLLESFQRVKIDRDKYRQRLVEAGLLLHESSLGYPPLPTTCATDGSYGIERLLSSDLAAAAAVAVEGLTPPSEKRHWEQPRHSTFVAAERHHGDTATVLRAVMLGRELLLATSAPHDLVMLDMTLTLPIIYFNQALSQAPEIAHLQCSEEFIKHCVEYLQSYLDLLRAQRSDRQYVGLPKYSTRREIGRAVDWPGEHDDRGLLSLILQPGEYTRPHSLDQPSQPWHLYATRLRGATRTAAEALAEQIVAELPQVRVLYYRPHEWLPALRVEMPRSIAENGHRLAPVLQGLKHQCATPAMLEPYPLYLADRTVKALARAIPAFRQVATQHISERYDGDIGEVFFAMHGYRSEAGG